MSRRDFNVTPFINSHPSTHTYTAGKHAKETIFDFFFWLTDGKRLGDKIFKKNRDETTLKTIVIRCLSIKNHFIRISSSIHTIESKRQGYDKHQICFLSIHWKSLNFLNLIDVMWQMMKRLILESKSTNKSHRFSSSNRLIFLPGATVCLNEFWSLWIKLPTTSDRQEVWRDIVVLPIQLENLLFWCEIVRQTNQIVQVENIDFIVQSVGRSISRWRWKINRKHGERHRKEKGKINSDLCHWTFRHSMVSMFLLLDRFVL